MRDRVSWVPAITIAATLLMTTPLAGQQGRIELGFDTGITISDPEGGDAVTEIAIPNRRVRFAAFFTDAVALETSVGFRLLDSGGSTTSATQIAVGTSIHFPSDHTKTRLYVSPFGAITHINTASADSFTQGSAGGLLGVKFPLSEILGLRLEGSYARAFETDELAATNNFRGIVGLSFFID